MKYLLDTNVCIAAMKGDPAVVFNMAKRSPGDCAISTVSVYELYAGVFKSNDPDKHRRKVELLVGTLSVLPYDSDAAIASAKLRAELEAVGKKIGPYDTQIAGHGLSTNLIVVTNNTLEFSRVRELKLEDWAE